MEENLTIEQGVLEEFRWLCQTPHPSGGEAQISRALMQRLTEMGLKPEQDSAGNIICDVPATTGMEQAGMLALQAHMDMVCVGEEDYCPETDPIVAIIEDGYLKSDGRSSLGADCGIGLAAAMYVVEQKWPHGALRLIFTVDEERGLAGAQKIRTDCLTGCTGLINLDGFRFGKVTISSAGGLRQTFTKETERFFPMLDRAVRLEIGGLKGGHSGDDIGLERGNAARILVWLLESLQIPYELAELKAGCTHNAIPTEGYAIINTDARDQEQLDTACGAFLEGIRELYPNENITLTVTETKQPQWVMTVDARDDFLAMGALLRCGPAEMHPICPDVVGASGSMGMLYGDSERMEIRSFLRASREEFMDTQGAFYQTAAEGFGYEVYAERYGAWPGVEEDPLSRSFIEQGRTLGIAMEKTAAHVGLETSIFHSLAPELPMVTVGMEIYDPHSVSERVRLDTAAPFVRLLGAVLEKWQ